VQKSLNPKNHDGSRNELRGTWFPTEFVSCWEVPLDVSEVNFQNRGFYPATIGMGQKSYAFGEGKPFYLELRIQPKEIIRAYVLPEPVRQFWIRSDRRITRIYYLLKG